MRPHFVAAPLAVLASLAIPRVALAQEEVSPTGKGITGGALLGGEAIMLVEAAVGVKPTWAYIAGGVVGAAGGGVGGYYVEQGSDPKLSLYLLAGGMAFFIPTTVAVLSANAYEPPADYTEDRRPADEPVAEPPQPAGGAAPAPAAPAEPAVAPPASSRLPGAGRARMSLHRPAIAPALVGIDRGLMLSVPAVEVRDLYTRREVADLGLRQGTEVRVPVLNVIF